MPRLIAIAVFMAAAACAEVVDSSPGGFTVKLTLNVQAPPADVYKHFFEPANWWNSAHTFSRNSKNLSMEQKPGGCFCETFPSGGGVKHMEVAMLRPGGILLHGTLGPLLSVAAAGSMEIQMTAADAGTKLQVTYTVAGYLPKGMNTWASAVDGVLNEQFTRLKNFAEHGSPDAPR